MTWTHFRTELLCQSTRILKDSSCPASACSIRVPSPNSMALGMVAISLPPQRGLSGQACCLTADWVPTKPGCCQSFQMRLVPFPLRKTTEQTRVGGEIQVVSSSRDAACRVDLAGRLTIHSSPELSALLMERLASASCQGATLNFYDVVYNDTSGLAMVCQVLH